MDFDYYEEIILGNCLLKPGIIKTLDCEIDYFEVPEYKIIYKTLLEMVSQGKALDFDVVAHELSVLHPKIDWLPLTAEIYSNAMGHSSLTVFLEALKDRRDKKREQEILQQALQRLKAGEQISDFVVTEFLTLLKKQNHKTKHIKEALPSVMQDIYDLCENKPKQGVLTGFDSLNKTLSCFANSFLYVIGARPAMGKTALMLNFMHRVNAPCLFFSTEQSTSQIIKRLMAMNSSVAGGKFLHGGFTDIDLNRITHTVGVLSERNIFIEDAAPTIDELISIARYYHYKHNIKIIHLDYIQHMKLRDRRAPKHEQIEEILIGLKNLAKELNIPVVALSQVNRDVERRENKRPFASDLCDSSSIEKEADVIMMLYRDEVYNEMSEARGLAELNLEKNRHGKLLKLILEFNGSTFTFDDYRYNERYD